MADFSLSIFNLPGIDVTMIQLRHRIETLTFLSVFTDLLHKDVSSLIRINLQLLL